MPYFLPFGKAEELQIPRCKGFAVDYYGFTLCALALKPSDFYNIGVTYGKHNEVSTLATYDKIPYLTLETRLFI